MGATAVWLRGVSAVLAMWIIKAALLSPHQGYLQDGGGLFFRRMSGFTKRQELIIE